MQFWSTVLWLTETRVHGDARDISDWKTEIQRSQWTCTGLCMLTLWMANMLLQRTECSKICWIVLFHLVFAFFFLEKIAGVSNMWIRYLVKSNSLVFSWLLFNFIFFFPWLDHICALYATSIYKVLVLFRPGADEALWIEDGPNSQERPWVCASL